MALSRSVSKLGEGGTVVAIDREKASGQALVKWAVDNLLRGHKRSYCVILHVLDHTSNSHNINGSKGSSPSSSEDKIQQIFLPCLGYCALKGVTAKEVIMHDIDIPSAIIDYITKNEIINLVVGSSNHNAIMRKFKEADVPSSLLRSAPDFCSVYVVSKGRTQTVRGATQRIEFKQSTNRSSNGTVNSLLSEASQNSTWTSTATASSSVSSASSMRSEFPWSQSSQSDIGFDSFTASSVGDSFVLQSQEEFDAEMDKLNLQLKHTRDIYNSGNDEAKVAKEKVNEVNLKPAIKEVIIPEEDHPISEELFVELDWKNPTKTLEKPKVAEEDGGGQYRRYSIKEIEAATDHFNMNRMIGEGGYGPVYKGVLDHTSVAIKVLRPDISQGLVQFRKEVEVLSYIRHPNMVLLVGACPEFGCLVYDYMENGSLEDRLDRKDGSPALSWRDRFRIAAEIGSALLFLHNRKPEPLVHRDLKPANILLDRNLVGKIGDVGLAQLVPASVADAVTQYHQTAAVGTFCYIDPEYQQTGMLGVKSDVYSLGVVLLQILTAKPPIGLSFMVEEAIEQGNIERVLDPVVTDWPVEEALKLAELALRCCEMRKRDRPSLASGVLPELNRLRSFAMEN